MLGDSFKTVPGGKGANQAVAAARLGAEVNMIGCVGEDSFGEMILSNLKSNGVMTDYVEPVTGMESGTAHIILAEETTASWWLKAPTTGYSEYVDQAAEVIQARISS